jgi:hypothetical protein
MALSTRRWIGLAASGFLILGIWMLPPSAYRTSGPVLTSPEEARAAQLRRELRRARDILVRTRWADSITPLTLTSARDGVAVGGDPRVVDGATLDSVRVRVGEELARVGSTGRAVVGVFIQPRHFAAPDVAVADVNRVEDTYIGLLDGSPYCYRVIGAPGRVTHTSAPLRRVSLSPTRHYSNILGSCRLVARYGLPGPAVLAWLERGALGFATEPVHDPARSQRRLLPARSLFGLGGPSYWIRSRSVARCLAGIDGSCGRLLSDPVSEADEGRSEIQHVVDRSPVSGIREEAYGEPFAHYDNYLLADLEADFGARRFAAFWRSQHQVSTAFEAAFGTPLDLWTAAWARTHVGSLEAGPGLPGSTSTGTGLLLVACAALAGLWARRRRVA